MQELFAKVQFVADTPKTIKVALGIGQLRIGKLLFGGYSSKAKHCVPCAQMPNAQLPMTNCQSNLY